MQTDEPRQDPQADENAGAFQPDATGADTGLQFPESQETHGEPNDSTEADREDRPAEAEEREGILAGTESERAPGVGLADHPAPAAVIGQDGRLHVAGEPPAGNQALGQSPVGDDTDEQSGQDVTDPEARERLNAVTEPEPYETDRPDLGTE